MSQLILLFVDPKFCFKACADYYKLLRFPGTVGSNVHDYIVSDHNSIPPENIKYFNEKNNFYAEYILLL